MQTELDERDAELAEANARIEELVIKMKDMATTPPATIRAVSESKVLQQSPSTVASIFAPSVADQEVPVDVNSLNITYGKQTVY